MKAGLPSLFRLVLTVRVARQTWMTANIAAAGCCMISDVLDLSCALEGCLVQPGVCDPLDELRETLQQLPATLTEVRNSTHFGVALFFAMRHGSVLEAGAAQFMQGAPLDRTGANRPCFPERCC